MGAVVVVDLRRRRPRLPKMNSRKRHRRRALLIWAQDNICAHCEEPFPETFGPNDPDAPTIEHVEPRSQGGADGMENLMVKHKACNEAGGSRPPSRRDRKWQAIVAARLAAHSANRATRTERPSQPPESP